MKAAPIDLDLVHRLNVAIDRAESIGRADLERLEEATSEAGRLLAEIHRAHYRAGERVGEFLRMLLPLHAHRYAAKAAKFASRPQFDRGRP